MRTVLEPKHYGQYQIHYRLLLGSEDIGEAWICKRDFSHNPLPSDKCYICSVEIWKGFRGKGYGKELIEHILEAARQLGYKYAILDVLPNNDIAIKIYESFGFKIINPSKIYKESAWKMELDLEECYVEN